MKLKPVSFVRITFDELQKHQEEVRSFKENLEKQPVVRAVRAAIDEGLIPVRLREKDDVVQKYSFYFTRMTAQLGGALSLGAEVTAHSEIEGQDYTVHVNLTVPRKFLDEEFAPEEFNSYCQSLRQDAADKAAQAARAAQEWAVEMQRRVVAPQKS